MKTTIALLLLLAASARAADTNLETACRAHLRNLGGAVKAYALIHDNKPPAKISDLFREGLVDSPGDFACPASGVSITAAAEIETKTDYALGSGDVLIREKTARHDGKALAVFADGSIKPVDAPAATATETARKPPAVSEPAAPPRANPVQPVVPEVQATGATDTPPAIVPKTSQPKSSVTRDAASAPGLTPEMLAEFERKARANLPVSNETTNDDEPVFKVTKASPGISVVQEGDSEFDEMLGLTLAFQKGGALVVGSVKADSIGGELGFKAGDSVVEINHQSPPQGKAAGDVTPADLEKLVGVAPGKEMLLGIRKSDGKVVSFSLKAAPNKSPAK